MNGTKNRATRFAAGCALALAMVAGLPGSVMANVEAIEADPVLMCDETATRIVCCAVEAGQIKSCRVMVK
jgi:hypothetical protein